MTTEELWDTLIHVCIRVSHNSSTLEFVVIYCITINDLRFARRLQDNLFNDEDDDGYGYDGENKFGNDDDAW